MKNTIELELPNGNILFFGSSGEGGLEEVSLAEKLPKAAAAQFEKALGTLGDLIDVLERHIGALPNRPSKVECEFGASLSSDCNLWIVSGEGKAEFKVKPAWEGAKPNAPA
jgi:Trypsin-co-occurring domain 1